MATPTFVSTLIPENLNWSANSSSLNSLATGTNLRPPIRVLAGPLRLTSYQPFPILLDASDPLVQESETVDNHIIVLLSPPSPTPQQDSTLVNGVIAWGSQMKGRLAAFATRTISRLRRVLHVE